MSDCLIKDLSRHAGETVTIKGWVANKRSSGKVSFLVIRDGSGICQAIVERENFSGDYEEIKKLPIESSVIARGRVVAESRSPGGFELHVEAVEILQRSEEFPIGKKSTARISF